LSQNKAGSSQRESKYWKCKSIELHTLNFLHDYCTFRSDDRISCLVVLKRLEEEKTWFRAHVFLAGLGLCSLR
jgi:hypothetical protein